MKNKTKTKIYCLFSLYNDYNQPPNNLVAFWLEKPSLEILAKAIDFDFPHTDDQITLGIVKIWEGKEVRLGSVDFRIEQVTEGDILDWE